MNDINTRLDEIERLLYALVPYRKLTTAQKARSLELLGQPERAAVLGDRAKIVDKEWQRLVAMDAGDRRQSRFPKFLVPKMVRDAKEGVREEDALPVIPLSLLVNRVKQRKAFKTDPTEDVPHAIELIIEKLGLVTANANRLGIEGGFDSVVQLVTTREFAEKRGAVKAPVVKVAKVVKVVKKPVVKFSEAELEAIDMGEKPEVSEKQAERLARWSAEPEEPEEENALEVANPQVEALKGFDDDGDEEEQTFETSEAAQGVALVGGDREEEVWDDEVIEDDTEDDDWGPDEEEIENPVAAEFRRQADEAWEREQALLESGELVMVDGIPVAKANRKN